MNGEPAGGIGQTATGDLAGRAAASDLIVSVADRIDREIAELRTALAPVIETAALMAGEGGDRRTAATLYDWLGRKFAGFGYVADDYKRRAKECRRRRRTGK